MTLRRSVVAGLTLLAACVPNDNGVPSQSPADLLPPDSAVNPIVVRVEDIVADSSLRSLKPEISISPGLNDASTFTRIQEFAVDKSGSFWVYDEPSNSIFVFSPEGKLKFQVGREGKGPGEFRFNGGMVALPDGRIAVSDDANSRVSFFSAEGKFETSWHLPIGSVRLRALVTDAAGQLFVKRSIYPENGGRFQRSRESLIRIRDGKSGDTLFAPDLRIPVIDYVVHSEEGEKSQMVAVTNAEYAPKMHWDWHPDGFFVTGHGERYQITLFREKERPIVIERTLAPVPVSAAEREMEERMILGGASRKWEGPPLPGVKPPLMDMMVAVDGRIWARVAAPSIAKEIDNPDKRPGKPASITVYSTPVLWEAFSPEGEFLGRVKLPDGATLMRAQGNQVWAIARGEDDLQSVVRYRVEPPL